MSLPLTQAQRLDGARTIVNFLRRNPKKGSLSAWQWFSQQIVIRRASRHKFAPIPAEGYDGGAAGTVWNDMWSTLLSKAKVDTSFNLATALTVRALMIKGVSRERIAQTQFSLSQQHSRYVKDRQLRRDLVASIRPGCRKLSTTAASLPTKLQHNLGLKTCTLHDSRLSRTASLPSARPRPQSLPVGYSTPTSSTTDANPFASGCPLIWSRRVSFAVGHSTPSSPTTDVTPPAIAHRLISRHSSM